MKPQIQSSRLIKLIDLPEQSIQAMFYDSIESNGLVEYEYLMIVFRNESDDPVMYVTSEVNSNYEAEQDNSHLLCVMKEGKHINIGSSDSYGSKDSFEENAISIIEEML